MSEPRGARTTTPINLTHRETDVVRLVAAGHSSKEIAKRLGIAPKTVEGYVEHARLKLGACNRSSLTARAAAMGLIEVDVIG